MRTALLGFQAGSRLETGATGFGIGSDSTLRTGAVEPGGACTSLKPPSAAKVPVLASRQSVGPSNPGNGAAPGVREREHQEQGVQSWPISCFR